MASFLGVFWMIILLAMLLVVVVAVGIVLIAILLDIFWPIKDQPFPEYDRALRQSRKAMFAERPSLTEDEIDAKLKAMWPPPAA